MACGKIVLQSRMASSTKCSILNYREMDGRLCVMRVCANVPQALTANMTLCSLAAYGLPDTAGQYLRT